MFIDNKIEKKVGKKQNKKNNYSSSYKQKGFTTNWNVLKVVRKSFQ